MFAPVRVRAPAPDLVRLRAPVPSFRTPENVPPPVTVSVAALPLSVTVPVLMSPP